MGFGGDCCFDYILGLIWELSNLTTGAALVPGYIVRNMLLASLRLPICFACVLHVVRGYMSMIIFSWDVL